MSFGAVPLKDEPGRVERWNAEYPPGTAVLYQPVLGMPQVQPTKTTTNAWLLSGHTAVVRVEGISGAVALRNLMVQVAAKTGEEEEFFLLSAKHSPGPDGVALWWGPNDCGYVHDLRTAGRYSRAVILARPERYDNERTIPVPVHEALELTLTVAPWDLAREKFARTGESPRLTTPEARS